MVRCKPFGLVVRSGSQDPLGETTESDSQPVRKIRDQYESGRARFIIGDDESTDDDDRESGAAASQAAAAKEAARAQRMIALAAESAALAASALELEVPVRRQESFVIDLTAVS